MDQKQIIKAMKALSNENRFKLFMEISNNSHTTEINEEECFVYDIMDKLKIGSPTISHHLKELANADLIITERRGKNLVARINKEAIEKLKGILDIV